MIEKIFLSFFIFVNFIFSQYSTTDFPKENTFFNFEEDIQLWKITPIKNNCVKEVNFSNEKYIGGKRSLEIKLENYGEGSVEKEFFKDLSVYKNIIFNIYIPKEAPDDIKICFFLQDNEWLWYQTPLFSLKKDQWNKITINVEPQSTFWENIGHSQPWSEKTICNIRKIGIKIFFNTNFTGSIYIDEIKGSFKVFPEISTNKKKILQFEKFEISFFLPQKYSNPFDPEEIDVKGVFIDPDDNTISIPGFYYQEYERFLENGEEILVPVGYPYWKIRFTPEKVGRYKFFVCLREYDKEIKTDINYFIVEPIETKNKFIKVSKTDNRFFSYKSGEFFYPVGFNIRSPTDERYAKMMRKNVDPDNGTFYYEYIFKKMKENGINFTEVWMAPWFSALEWKENRPGYRGVGYYNLRNAWKIDKIIEFAEINDIYIQLVIINHGQLSTWCDQEWQDNPYNIKNGGFLKSPNEFFTNERAKRLLKNKLRYIVARWGYSPYIFSWEILNEINLVGDSHNFYLGEEITKWYKEMKEYLNEIDPFAHMVTAHYTILVDNKILSDIIDYTITNGYYDFRRSNLPTFFKNIYSFNSYFKKPTFISEYGGTPMGSSFENLKRDIIMGLWFSFHLPFAGTPLFWWHRFIDEFDLYYIYKIFSEYIKGIDRLKSPVETEIINVEGEGKDQIFSIGTGNRFFSSILLYDYSITKDMTRGDFSEYSNLICFLKNKKPGKFKVEFYNLEKGKIEEKEVLSDEKGNLKIEIPPFKKWIAIKVNFYE
ncbi:MAG: DUF5060 domain-containing protein [Candidatus Omnitrophica bacterium]|nr:DUF5060 domain-containing protein [Candidatus Omnitrophota bacterium]MCM8802730.1 DUF5060 domain-containing protein [Candidatus Omnitrophota bacterium]